MARLERDGEFAEQLFTHGLGVQTAEGMAEWLHWRVREDLGIPATQGRRYSWGYPAIPEQAEHEKVYRLLDATERDRPAPLRRLRRRARAVHAGARSPTIPRRSTSARRAGGCCPTATRAAPTT